MRAYLVSMADGERIYVEALHKADAAARVAAHVKQELGRLPGFMPDFGRATTVTGVQRISVREFRQAAAKVRQLRTRGVA